MFVGFSTKNVIRLMLLSSIRSVKPESAENETTISTLRANLELVSEVVQSEDEERPDWLTEEYLALFEAVKQHTNEETIDWEGIRSNLQWMSSVENIRLKWDLLVIYAKDHLRIHKPTRSPVTYKFTRQDAALGVHRVLESVPKPSSSTPFALANIFNTRGGESSLSAFTPNASLSSTFSSTSRSTSPPQ
eukprot:c8747_g1_i1.p2 GENE.c8747_g1_i1~~c8747_g1_i1.p2  ORF type:complete len:190 (+),score=39.29 c8747_g1_i1:686-1255(+)